MKWGWARWGDGPGSWHHDEAGCAFDSGCGCTTSAADPGSNGTQEMPGTPLVSPRAPEQHQLPPPRDEIARHLPGGRMARASVRMLEWHQGDWLRALVDISVKGDVVLAAGRCAKVVELPAENDRVIVSFEDGSGESRTLKVLKDKFSKLVYKQQLAQAEAHAAAKRARIQERGLDWCPGLGEVDAKDDALPKELYKDERTGQKFRAASAEQAAQKAWRVSKKHQELRMINSAGAVTFHSSASFSVPGKDGVRGGPKFTSGKHAKRNPTRRRSWAEYACHDYS
eukprot:TRINITY_DN31063_c0_g1_i2.p1 TRINITY_DN31063_c0_g1~~TRINITY_DN31063_c0_g1_i2.p1  ORF type:complete len:283 (+),score=85.90 TRINITY_DN31063_c0_g1_i2:92-940(+)